MHHSHSRVTERWILWKSDKDWPLKRDWEIVVVFLVHIGNEMVPIRPWPDQETFPPT